MSHPFPLLRKFTISGHSMEPTLKAGKLVLVSKLPYVLQQPRVNDLIAFNYQAKIFIKRIIDISHDGITVQGDNASDSLDSRQIGLIAQDQLIGKVVAVL